MSDDLELKFDGPPINRLGGAPADAVIKSLSALQRVVHLIGMRSEGRQFGQRVKPSAKVRREYTLICRAPEEGSHVQPFSIGNHAGKFTPAAMAARDQLLTLLKAFDNDDEEALEAAIPNARQRWFVADAVAGLLPDEESDLQVTVRKGRHGPFAFKADRARDLVESVRAGEPPEPDIETVVGKIDTIDYKRTSMIIQRTGHRALKVAYPLVIEKFLQANARRRIAIEAKPVVNSMGDVTKLTDINFISEVESSIEKIEYFDSGGSRIMTDKPLSVHVKYDFEDCLFVFQNERLGIDSYSETYEGLRSAVLAELGVNWRNYALAPDSDLDSDALRVKKALLARFSEMAR